MTTQIKQQYYRSKLTSGKSSNEKNSSTQKLKKMFPSEVDSQLLLLIYSTGHRNSSMCKNYACKMAKLRQNTRALHACKILHELLQAPEITHTVCTCNLSGVKLPCSLHVDCMYFPLSNVHESDYES